MFNFSEPEVPQVTCEDVKKAIDTKESFVLLDVRTPGEYERARIERSMNVPVDKIECDVETNVPDKARKIYVYCFSGSRSVHAVDAMRKLGYTNVFDMKQGLLAWRAKRFPVAS